MHSGPKWIAGKEKNLVALLGIFTQTNLNVDDYKKKSPESQCRKQGDSVFEKAQNFLI